MANLLIFHLLPTTLLIHIREISFETTVKTWENEKIFKYDKQKERKDDLCNLCLIEPNRCFNSHQEI